MIALALVSALLPLALVQEPLAQEPLTRQTERNTLLDGVAVQAGEGLVTLSEYEHMLESYKERRPPRNREEEDRMRLEVLRTISSWRLEEQRGEDLGLDPVQIERISRLDLQAQREKAGLQAYLAELRAEGKDALLEENDRQRAILRYMWQESALGRAYAAKRQTRDLDIRPGELHALYEENKRNLAPVTVQYRILIVSSERAGSPEKARAICEDARARVLLGEQLELIVEQEGDDLRESRGLTPYIPPQALPDLASFVEQAELTDLSEVLPLSDPRTGKPEPRLGYQLAELVDRRVPEIPEYDTAEVQRVLRKHFADRRSEDVLGRERERLRREAYSWVNPLLMGSAPTGPTSAGPQAPK